MRDLLQRIGAFSEGRQWMCQAPSTGRSVDFGLIKAVAQEVVDFVKLGSY